MAGFFKKLFDRLSGNNLESAKPKPEPVKPQPKPVPVESVESVEPVKLQPKPESEPVEPKPKPEPVKPQPQPKPVPVEPVEPKSKDVVNLPKKGIQDSQEPKNQDFPKSVNAPQSEPSTDPAIKQVVKAVARSPYFVQVGLDFGTSFCKVVCRDVIIDSAWVHFPSHEADPEHPFLISSAIRFADGMLQQAAPKMDIYEEDALIHVKMALQAIAENELENPALERFKAVKPIRVHINDFVFCCSVFLLSGIIKEVRAGISAKFPGVVEGDQVRTNLAVPVADMKEQDVMILFKKVIQRAWILSEKMPDQEPISYDEFSRLCEASVEAAEMEEIRDACRVYPEVGAAVQGFIQSRASQRGLYMHSDTGAGTVDQCVFRYYENEEGKGLTFYAAQVLPLGSGKIEEKALAFSSENGEKALDDLRKQKESGVENVFISEAKKEIEIELSKWSLKPIALTKMKLIVTDAINDLKILFGGGGHCKNPYAISVSKQFDAPIFNEERIQNRRISEPNFDRGFPNLSHELGLEADRGRWSKRLAVAYGLSFYQDDEGGDLPHYTLPSENDTVPPEERFITRYRPPCAPSKDDV